MAKAASKTVKPKGIPTGEAFGKLIIVPSMTIKLKGIVSGEAFGKLALPKTKTIILKGIPSGEAVGKPLVLKTKIVIPRGIPTGETFGKPTVTLTARRILVKGIPTGEKFGKLRINHWLQVDGIPSSEAFGVLQAGIAAWKYIGESASSIEGIPTGETFGTVSVERSSTMSRQTITGSSLTVGEDITFILYPPGNTVYDQNGNTFPQRVRTTVNASGNFTVELEETDTMSLAGMAWAMFLGETEYDAVPLTYLNFGSGGGAYGSLEVAAPTEPTVLGPVLRIVQGAGIHISAVGGVVTISVSPPNNAPVIAKVALAAVDTAGGIFAWQAPVACFIRELLLDVTTVASGACTIDAGPAANATTLNDTLIDGADAHTAVASFSSRDATGGGSNQAYIDAILTFKKMAANAWITGSKASGASAGLVGNAYIKYEPV